MMKKIGLSNSPLFAVCIVVCLALVGCGEAEEGASAEAGDGLAAEGSPFECTVVSDWPDARAVLEQEVIVEVNIRRAGGADCHTMGIFEPTHGLTHNDRLQCAARGHSEDMVVRDFFDHVSPDGGKITDRINAVGYDYAHLGENIAAGHMNAKEVVDGWMTSDGHCSNIMSPDYLEIGVGFHEADGAPMWTQVFGTSF